MAQHEINIEAGIIPVLDQRSADAVMKRLQTMLSRLGTAQHTALAQEFQNLFAQGVASRVASGKATTATSARIAMEQALGVTGGSAAKALTREAADMAAIAIKQGRVSPYSAFSEKRIKTWKSDLAGAAGAYNDMLKSYDAFKVAPSKEAQNELIKAIMLVNAQLANIGKDRKRETKIFGQIEKDTKAIHKEAKDFTKPTDTANTLGAAAAIKGTMKGIMRGAFGIFGLSSIWGGLKKFGSMGIQSIQEGYNDLVEQSVYGKNRNIAGTRSLATMYGMKEESLVGAERYALDFRQRMIMGEVSDREFIALSKMGSLGQMIVSGEAGRNPQQFQKALQEYIRVNKGNEAEVRQNLRYLGLNPEIMAYGAIEHEAEREKQIRDVYEELVRGNKISALSTLIPSQIYKTAKSQVGAASGRLWAMFSSGEESQHLLYRSMTRGSGFTANEVESAYADLAYRSAANARISRDYGALGAAVMPGVGALEQIYKSNLEMQTEVAGMYKALPISTKDGTREGAKEGIIEGLKEVLQNSTNRTNFDQTTMGLTNFSLSNGGAS